jgi:hypothetical protein
VVEVVVLAVVVVVVVEGRVITSVASGGVSASGGPQPERITAKATMMVRRTVASDPDRGGDGR